MVKTNIKGVISVNGKKIVVYFIGFLSLSLVFTAGYYFSYKKALDDFNRNADKRNNELFTSLEEKGLLIIQDDNYVSTNSQDESQLSQEKDVVLEANLDIPTQEEDRSDDGREVDNVEDIIVLPTTKYILQTYNTSTAKKTDEVLKPPSFLLGLNRQEVIEYLDNYMDDLPWNEFKQGLTAYELLLFSDKEILIRKTYNPDLIEYEYYIKAVDDNIVVYYSDQKTVYEYTNMSIINLAEEEKQELEEGYFIKDLTELYAILENYTS